MSEHTATNTIKDDLDELKRVLGLIDEQYRLVQTFDKYSYIRSLHKQARKLLGQIEQALEESEQGKE